MVLLCKHSHDDFVVRRLTSTIIILKCRRKTKMTGIFFPKTPTVVKIISTWNFSLKMIFFAERNRQHSVFFIYYIKKLPFFEEVAKMEFNFGGVSLSSYHCTSKRIILSKKSGSWYKLLKKIFFYHILQRPGKF